MKCEPCGGTGRYCPEDLDPCPICCGSGVTTAPRTEGPRRLELDVGFSPCGLVFEEGKHSGRLMLMVASKNTSHIYIADTLSADAECQLYELLKLRAEQGPPREGTDGKV